MEERYYETEDLPVSAVGREARIWFGDYSPPLAWSEVFLKATEISRAEFEQLRRLTAWGRTSARSRRRTA